MSHKISTQINICLCKTICGKESALSTVTIHSLIHVLASMLSQRKRKKKVPLYKKQSYPPNDDFIDVTYFSAVPCTSFLDACQFCTRQVVKHILIRSKHTELMQKHTEDRGISIDTKTQTRGQTHTLSLSLTHTHTHIYTHTHTYTHTIKNTINIQNIAIMQVL